MEKLSIRKTILTDIMEKRPDAKLTKNKYRVIAKMIHEMYPDETSVIPQSKLADILAEAINGDRDWRLLAHDTATEEKQRLSEEWQINNGYSRFH